MFLGVSYLEWAANITTAICIFLAGRNNVHTWWTGIVACVLFGFVFFDAKLYADVSLQAFFIVTGIGGWMAWVKMNGKEPLPITSVSTQAMTIYFFTAVVTAGFYGYTLYRLTDASAPFVDSMVLTFSVMAQLLLMRRHIQTWPMWLLVNTLSVPLYIYKELYVTAFMYSLFWINAIVSWRHWLNLRDDQDIAVNNARVNPDITYGPSQV